MDRAHCAHSIGLGTPKSDGDSEVPDGTPSP